MKFTVKAVALLTGAVVVTATATQARLTTHGITHSPATFAAQAFDYVIVGGGTAGLTLTESGTATVGVIEAGDLHFPEPLIDTPSMAGEDLISPTLSWQFTTVPQEHLGGRAVIYPRGKMLGGSSGLNLLAWTRPHRQELDAWKELGIAGGWNWTGLLPFMMKTETVSPGPDGVFPGSTHVPGFDSTVQGRSGPVQVGYNNFYSPAVGPFVESFVNMGAVVNDDPENGDNIGVFNCQRSADDRTGNRSYATTAYFLPNQHRSNLLVLTQARVSKVTFNRSSKRLLEATGVQYVVNGSTYSAQARKEIILSAGSLQTPQVLELSGIGSQTLLKSLGINVLLDIPTVGENLQDHHGIVTTFKLKEPAPVTQDALVNNSTFAAQQHMEYLVNHTGLFTATAPPFSFHPLQSFLSNSTVTDQIASVRKELSSRELTPLHKAQSEIQLKWLEQGVVGQIEIVMLAGAALGEPITPAPGESDISLFAYQQHLFSRGSVHINTTSPLAAPLIDPNYFDFDFDNQFMSNGLSILDKIAATKPISDMLETVTNPPANLTTVRERANYVAQNLVTEFHPIGTAAMAPQSLGGVVDDNLIVYGTSNLRVVDASIMPLHLSTHIQQVVYAIAEKAAIIIQERRSGN